MSDSTASRPPFLATVFLGSSTLLCLLTLFATADIRSDLQTVAASVSTPPSSNSDDPSARAAASTCAANAGQRDVDVSTRIFMEVPTGTSASIEGDRLYPAFPEDVDVFVHNHVQNWTSSLTRGKWPPDLWIQCRCDDTDAGICSPFYMAQNGDTPATCGCLPNDCANCRQTVFVKKADASGRRLALPSPVGSALAPEEGTRVDLLFFRAAASRVVDPLGSPFQDDGETFVPIKTMEEWNALPFVHSTEVRALDDQLAALVARARGPLWNVAVRTSSNRKFLATVPYSAIQAGQLFGAANGDTIKCSGCGSLMCVLARQGAIVYCQHSCGDECVMTVDFSTPRARPEVIDLDTSFEIVNKTVAFQPQDQGTVGRSKRDASRLELRYVTPYWPMGSGMELGARRSQDEPIVIECVCAEASADNYFCLPFVKLSTGKYGCMKNACDTCKRAMFVSTSIAKRTLFDAFLRRARGVAAAPIVAGVTFVTEDEAPDLWNTMNEYGSELVNADERSEARRVLDEEVGRALGRRTPGAEHRLVLLRIERNGILSRALVRMPLDKIPSGAYYSATPLYSDTSIECSGSCEFYTCYREMLNDLIFCAGCQSGCTMTITT